jgi:putative peptide zinc metalloprotease protein
MNELEKKDIVPRIKKKYSIFKKDKNKVLIIVDGNKRSSYLYCDEEIVKVLELVNGINTLSEISILLKFQDIELTIDSIYEILFIKLNKLVTDNDIEKHSNGFLFLNFILINEKYVKKISSYFSFIFKNQKRVTYTFIFFLFLALYLLIFKNQNFEITSQNIFVIPIVSLIVLFFHEIGHASACYTYGAKNGPIGFGFYLLTPVLYADVTDSWKLTKDKRLIIDIAGLYMEGLIMTFFTILYFVIGNDFFLYCAIVIIFNTIININPFLKFDGYWILCDLTNTYNLRQLSNENLFKLLRLKLEDFKPFNLFLAFYALMNFLFLFWFLFYMTFYRFLDLIYFPLNAYSFVKGWILQIPCDISFWQISLPIGFYFVLFFKAKELYFYTRNLIKNG